MPQNKGGNFRGQQGQARGMMNSTGQKIRLRRNVNVNKQAVIQQNLSHMEQQAQKKKLAQEYYYRNNQGQSPMRRGGGAAVENSNLENKPPVHNRLGNKIRLRRNKTAQTTVNIPQFINRIRLQSARQQQPTQRFGLNTDKIIRLHSVQNRLTRIRQATTFAQRNIVQNSNFQRGVVQRAMLQPGVINQKIRLRRNRPQPIRGAVNYTVQVANNTLTKNRKHHISAELNPTLQQEIRMIQSKSVQQNLVSTEAIHPVGTGITSKSLHDRFSEL